MNVLNVEKLSVRLGGSEILHDVSFGVEKGDFLCVTGPNGAGKTTLLKTLLGLIESYQGDFVFFGGESINSLIRNRIGYLPQRSFTINPLFPASAEEVVLLGIMAQKAFPKHATESDRERVKKTLSDLGSVDLAKRPYIELSGGQQQKILLARSLVRNPELLIMDEPATALDPESRKDFFSLVEKLNKQQEMTMIIVTHDMDYVGRYANKMLVLDRQVEYFGLAEDFLHKHRMTHHHDYE